MAEKLFILGLDGATFDLIRPWAAEGKLPNLARLLEEGVQATLTSTMPPVSPPAWCSFATGKNPGRHGILAFTRTDPTTYDVRFENSRTVRGRTFWRIASEAGKRVGAMNVPMTFPPEDVNGFVVGGIFSPSLRSRFVSPPAVQDALLAAVPGYVIECVDVDRARLKGDRLQAFFDRLLVMIEKRVEAIRFLYETQRPDIMSAVIVATDRASHYFWKHMDPKVADQVAPQERGKFTDALLRTYQKCDWAVGEVRKMLDDDTTLFVMSDHGFGPTYRRANLRRWLVENGYLAYSQRPGSRKGTLAHRLALASLRFLPLSVRNTIRHRFPRIANRAISALMVGGIDWSRTKAYVVAEHTALFVNVKGRQPQGVVEPGADYERTRDALIEQLTSWMDPFTGQSVFDKVYKREEIYNGECVEKLPDLILGWRGFEYTYTHELEMLKAPLVSMSISEPTGRWNRCANHRCEGIFLAVGPHVRRGETLADFSIADVAPTALHHVGLPVPRDMDGRVVEQIYDPGYAQAHPPQLGGEAVAAEPGAETARDTASDEDEEVVRERLRDLGYIE
jgi:predicted AlkP superfamily phosphohydrolase/phosphomutase